jgi:uncharacterized protein DUF3551
MRCGIIVSAALAAMAFTSLSTTGAQAQQWCGFAAHQGAIVQCGYTSQQGCENTIGKGAMCFINPYLVLNTASPRFELTAKERAKADA